jgi:hypothetical protein
MRLAATLAAYSFAIGIPVLGFVGGALWLVRPDPAASREVRPAPIPPRIAESIERQKPFPPQETAPEPVKVMTEANVSLVPAQVHLPVIREPRPPARQQRKPRSQRAVAAVREASSSPPARLSTGRSDVPY